MRFLRLFWTRKTGQNSWTNHRATTWLLCDLFCKFTIFFKVSCNAELGIAWWKYGRLILEIMLVGALYITTKWAFSTRTLQISRSLYIHICYMSYDAISNIMLCPFSSSVPCPLVSLTFTESLMLWNNSRYIHTVLSSLIVL